MSDSPPRHATSTGLVVLLLALLLGIQPITTDLFLPALPALVDSFGASMAQGQLTLTALLLAFGLSQLVFGPLSDRFGRRPILIWGLALYTVAAVGNVAATGIEWLLLTRTLQGAAMGAAVMGARAIIRDLYSPAEGARVMAKAMGGLGVIACVSPTLGGLLTDLGGWRTALAALVVFGAVVCGLVLLRFEESLAQPNPHALQWRSLAGNWLTIAANPSFLAWAGLLAASYGALFTFLAASSFVFIRVHGFSGQAFGLAMSSASLAYIAGTFLCRRLLPRFGLRGAVRVAALLTLTGGTLIGALAWAGLTTWWAFLLPLYLFMLGHGVHQPCAQTGAVSAFPQMAGAASALSGFFLTVVAFGTGAWLGRHLDGTVLALTNGMWFWCMVVTVLAWTAVQRYGEAAPVSVLVAAPR